MERPDPVTPRIVHSAKVVHDPIEVTDEYNTGH